MRNCLPKPLLLAIVAHVAMSAHIGQAQATKRQSPPDERVRLAIQQYLQAPPLGNFEQTTYRRAFVDLAGEGTEQVIIYLTGRGWCGTGGCYMLVLTKRGSEYRVIARVPAVRLPIRVLDFKAHGWHDLAVFTQGGGVLRGYEEAVTFDGTSYSRQSSDGSDRGRVQDMHGRVVLSPRDKDLPLYVK